METAILRVNSAISNGDAYVYLNNLGLTELPKSISKLTKATELDISRNCLTVLPETVCGLRNLKVLNAHSNAITSIYEEISEMDSLTRLTLYRNALTSIPTNIAGLAKLEHLDLDANSLSALPDAIDGLSSLRCLRVNCNKLVSLPDAIIRLKRLELMSLERNQLSGLPEGLLTLPSLKRIFIGGNPRLGLSDKECGDRESQAFPGENFRDAKKILSTYYSSIATTDASPSERLATDAERLLANNAENVEEAQSLVIAAIREDESLSNTLRHRFGYIFKSPGCPAKVEATDGIKWRIMVWKLLDIENSSSIPLRPRLSIGKATESSQSVITDSSGPARSSEETKDSHTASVSPASLEAYYSSIESSAEGRTGAVDDAAREASKHPQELGEDLEQGVVKVVSTLFFLSSQDSHTLLTRLRKQKAGIQHGHDISFAFESNVVLRPQVKCHVECKHITGVLRPSHVAEKLLAYAGSTDIDHWIIISPHADPSNDLEMYLENIRQNATFPFQVQVWSPATMVNELFEIEPTVYSRLYGHPVAEVDQRKNLKKRGEIVSRWLAKLKPVVKLGAAWERYLKMPGAMCLKYEGASQMEEHWKHYAPIYGASEAGVVQREATVVERLVRWAKTNGPTTLMILGGYGDGKTALTYAIARRLADDYLDNPQEGKIAVRFALSEYKSCDNARQFIDRRLEDIGVARPAWELARREGRLVIVLDGLDEMVHQLNSESIRKSIVSLRDIIGEVPNTHVLITSRPHFYDDSRNKQNFMTWVGVKELIHLRPIGRANVRRHLLETAKDSDDMAAIVDQLNKLNDPIGLATKPLFLQMLKETVCDMEGDIDVLDLYESHTQTALHRKVELLERCGEYNGLADDLVARLNVLLEDIAWHMQEQDAESVSLVKWSGNNHDGIASLLWSSLEASECGFAGLTHDRTSEEDAIRRVGSRSLLQRIDTEGSEPSWEVTFSHRSVREYYVARRILRELEDSSGEIVQLLNHVSIGREIVAFVADLVKKQNSTTAIDTLKAGLRLAATGVNVGAAGGHVVTWLHRLGVNLESLDLNNRCLDYAQLRGADLSGISFCGSSFREASFDNAVLTGADLSLCDLRGVKIEATTSVKSVLGIDENSFLATYSDGKVRHWNVRLTDDPIARVAADLREEVSLVASFGDQVLASGNGMYYMLEWSDLQLRLVFSGRIRSDVKTVRGSGEDFSVTIGAIDGVVRPQQIDLRRCVATSLGKEGLHHACTNAGAERCVVSTAGSGIFIQHMGSGRSVDIQQDTVSKQVCNCLSTIPRDNGSWLLCAGYDNGTVRIWDIGSPEAAITPALLFTAKVFKSPVTSIDWLSEMRFACSGLGNSLAVATLVPDAEGIQDVRVNRCELVVQCTGLRFAGVESEVERAMLDKLVRESAAMA